MQKHELAALSTRLTELADALGARAPGAGGVVVWGDALSGHSFDDVQNALTDWPRRNTKMPAPADIVKVCGERQGNRIERQAAANRESAGSFDGVPNPNSVVAKFEVLRMREILSDCHGGFVGGNFEHIAGNSAMDAKLWAKKLQIKEALGEDVSPTQASAWREALGMDRKAAA
jgi:hypothetical protein